jgi:hypothetical protein
MLRMLRTLLWVSLLLVVALGDALLWLLEPVPRTPGAGPPTPEDVAATRRFVTEVRALSSRRAGSIESVA